MQIYHGSSDSTLLPNNYNETIKQWSGVFGYDYTKPDSTKANTPQSGYTVSARTTVSTVAARFLTL